MEVVFVWFKRVALCGCDCCSFLKLPRRLPSSSSQECRNRYRIGCDALTKL